MTATRRFSPEDVFAALNAAGVRYVVIGGVAAALHGSPLRTGDSDVCPARDPENLDRLAAALRAIDASIRTGAGNGVALPADGVLLGTADTWNLSTRYGDVDVAFTPAGTDGYADLEPNAVRYELEGGVVVAVASLADVIRSKRAAGRPKDREALPVLEAVLEEQRDRR